MFFVDPLIVTARSVVVCAAPTVARAQSSPSVSIAATDPGLFGQLGNYEPLYIRLAHRSAQPVILQAAGLAAGEAVPGMSNGGRHAPAGDAVDRLSRSA
jgi:hypothetical protein